MSAIMFWLCALLFLVCCLIYYTRHTVWCRSQICLSGKTAIVTGANSGIGYETALDLAKRGARVILACRDESRAQEARSKIILQTGNDNVIVRVVDFASFESVRAFARTINSEEPRLDILVNNAGAGGIADKKSKDGLCLLMQVNYLSSFLLTNLLIDALKRSAPSRVVNVSSLLAAFASFDLDDLNRFVGHYATYANSKLCNILFTKELAKRLDRTHVTCYSVHPGVVRTNIFRKIQSAMKSVVFELLFKSPEEGAQTVIYTSVAQGVEKYNGEHFENCAKVGTYKTARVAGLSEKLWSKTEMLVQLTPEETQI